MTELKNKETELTVTKEAQEKLMGRIQTMESKLLCGGKNIIDHTNEQQRALQQRTQELMDQKVSSSLLSLFLVKHIHTFDLGFILFFSLLHTSTHNELGG